MALTEEEAGSTWFVAEVGSTEVEAVSTVSTVEKDEEDEVDSTLVGAQLTVPGALEEVVSTPEEVHLVLWQ